jgi:tRNA (cmo5U34)-methyltransferase
MSAFDNKAADWDNNPMHWERSEAIAKEITRIIPLKKEMTALEYGAGTGILSFLLKDSLGEITMMDNSSEMVRVMAGKIKTKETKNLKALFFDLEHSEFNEGKFDLIFTQMVLHHVTDIDTIINKFTKLLNLGGYLAIADLYLEDGSFHGEGFKGHNGFDIKKLSDQIIKRGFEISSLGKCFVLNKKISDTITKQFDVFLLVAKRNTTN